VEQDPETPPANADEWSDQQWIDWLKATDPDDGSAVDRARATVRRQVTHSASGKLLGNAMIGLARALYGPQDDKPAIIVESGEPESDQQLELHLDFDHPDRSFVIIRPDAERSE
jgi:hypothetical protein